MELVRKRLEIEVPGEIHEKLYSGLSRNYPPFISLAKANYEKLLRITSLESLPKRGEIFLLSDDVLFYYLIGGDKEYLEAGGIFYSGDVQNTFDDYLGGIKKILSGLSDKPVEAKDVPSFNPIFEHIREEADEYVFNPEDVEIAVELADPRLRNLIKALEERLILKEGFESSLIDKLISLKLAKREFIIICQKTGKQISQVSTQDSLNASHLGGFRCFSCGRPLSEEKIEEVISLTVTGRANLQPNYWLSLYLMKYLKKFGIKDSMILTKIVKRHNLIDCFINYNGFLIFGGIKDSPLELQDVYYFITQARYYQVDCGFILNPYILSEPVKYFLEHQADFPIRVINSLDEIDEAIYFTFEGLKQTLVGKVLREFNSFTGVEINQLLARFFKEASLPQEEAEEEKPELITEGGTEKERIVTGVENEIIEQKVSHLLEDIKTNGIVGRYNLLREKFLDLGKIPFYSAALIDSREALYIVFELSPYWEKDLCPRLSEIFTNLNRMQKNLQFEFKRFIIGGEKGKFQFDYVDENLFVLVAREAGKRDGKKTPKILKEGDLAHAVDSLCKLEGSCGCIWVGRDGLIIEDKLQQVDFDKSVIGSFITQIIMDNKNDYAKLVSILEYFILFFNDYVIMVREISGAGSLVSVISLESYLKKWDKICEAMRM